MEKHYGFLQTVHGSDKLLIFSENELLNEWNISKTDLPTNKKYVKCMAFFPFGGSNSSDSSIYLLETEEDIKDFLHQNGEVDYEDPPLVALAEYYFQIVIDTGCAGEWIKKLGLDKETLEKEASKDVADRITYICDTLGIGLKDFYSNEWREVRESEVDNIAKRETT